MCQTARYPISAASILGKAATKLGESAILVPSREDTPKVGAFGNMPIASIDRNVITDRGSSLGPQMPKST